MKHRPVVSEHPEGEIYIIGCICGHSICAQLVLYLRRREFKSTFGRLCDEDIHKIKTGRKISLVE